MKVVRTVTFEMNMEAQTIGDIWGISDKRAEVLREKVIEKVKKVKTWHELYRWIFEEFDGNEAMYLYGFVNYVWGYDDGKNEAVLQFIEALGGEGA